MKLGRFFRHVVFWTVPIIATVLLIITGFLYWLVATPAGTRWLMTTAALQFEGQAQGVQGTVWDGLELDHLHLKLPDQLTLELQGAALKVDWPRLWQQRELRLERVAAEKVAVWMDAEPKPAEPSTEPFTMPELPIHVRLDELYVGSVFFSQRGQLLPVDLSQLQLRAQAALTSQAVQLQLHQARINYEDIHLDLAAQADLAPIAAPWHSQLQLQASAHSEQGQSQICLQQYLPAHWVQPQIQPDLSGSDPASAEPDEHPDAQKTKTERQCEVALTAWWEGSLEQGKLHIQGSGQGLSLEASSELQLDQPIPLRDTHIDLRLPDESGVQAQLNWHRSAEQPDLDQLAGSIQVTRFDVGAWIPNVDLPSLVSFESSYAVQLSAGSTQLDSAKIALQLGEDSTWNKQTLAGRIVADLKRLDVPSLPELWQAYYLESSDIDLTIGQNSAQMKGAFGLTESALTVALAAPQLQQLWPTLTDIGATELEAELKGTLHEHQLTLTAQHDLGGGDEGKLGNGPVNATLGVKGVWDMNPETPNWQGSLQPLRVDHAGLAVLTDDTVRIAVQLPAPQQAWSVELGAFELQARLDNQALVQLQNQRTYVDAQGLQTKGQTTALTISEQRVKSVMDLLNLEQNESLHGGVVDTRASAATKVEDLQLQLEWDVALTEALSGRVRLQRVAGDVVVPTDPPFPLGLTQAEAILTFTPQGGAGRSVVQADVDLKTRSRGHISATGSTPIYYTADQGLHVRDADAKELHLTAQMDDLAWTSLFLKDQLELGGSLDARLHLESTPNGSFTSSGEMRGRNLKVVRLDDGIRLLDGSLEASLNNNRFQIDSLYFPAVLRVEPKEWRTATWVSENPDAQGGGLTITGYWELEQNLGDFDVNLYRYPILQRADRYAMVTGDIHLKAALPHIALSGKITADAGWFNLDMLGGIPTVDSDVVVVRSTDPVRQPSPEDTAPLDMTMNLEVDLGPRFYLTGYGVNSGLVGSLQIQMLNDQLTALGALNTRGGAIEIYGQRLQLRRGRVTFQGDISNPILDIQAFRTGLSVEAGVKVGGTARRPKIDLISVPEVSEIEKLSWLLFGHGPDEGGDIALLLSVGTSLLGGGEPFYRKFGIDELTMRSGELSGAGSILPANSVASSPESGVSEVEQRFIEASKILSNGIRLSIRQALSDTGTVGRTSYQLSRRLTAELSLGTVSGLALVYRWFSRD